MENLRLLLFTSTIFVFGDNSTSVPIKKQHLMKALSSMGPMEKFEIRLAILLQMPSAKSFNHKKILILCLACIAKHIFSNW